MHEMVKVFFILRGDINLIKTCPITEKGGGGIHLETVPCMQHGFSPKRHLTVNRTEIIKQSEVEEGGEYVYSHWSPLLKVQ